MSERREKKRRKLQRAEQAQPAYEGRRRTVLALFALAVCALVWRAADRQIFEKDFLQSEGADRVRVILEEHVPVSKQDEETAVALAFWEMALHDPELRAMFREKYRRWRDYLRSELAALLPDLAPDALDRRVDLAVAAADGLLVTFALDGRNYRQMDRRAILDDLMALLGLEQRKAAAA